MRSLRHLVSTSIALLVAAAPALAAASPSYPGLIVTQLNLDYSLGDPSCQTDPTPACHCTICHATNSGGVGTAITPFAVAMKAAGLTLENPPALMAALTALDMQGTDSDCNMLPDIEQLQAGRDPNSPGVYINGSSMTPPPDPGCGAAMVAYGCGAQLARVGAPWQGAAAVVAVLGVALARQRRRSRAR